MQYICAVSLSNLAGRQEEAHLDIGGLNGRAPMLQVLQATANARAVHVVCRLEVIHAVRHSSNQTNIKLVQERMLQCKAYMVQGRTKRGPPFSCANSYYTMRARSTARNAPHSMQVLVTADSE
jgi:hypothetical protein